MCLTAAGQNPHGDLCLQKTCMKEPSTYCDGAVVLDMHANIYLSPCMPCMLPTCRLWLQELAVDLLFYYPTICEATARTCAVVCLTDTFPVQLALRIIDVLSARTCQGDSSVLVSFLVTLLLGHVSQAQLSVNHARHAHLVEAVCRVICRVASPGGCSCGFLTLWLEAHRVHCTAVVQFAA